ncbi:MAG TPA: acetylxylan esterase [Opitutaceae bacterium]
MPLRLSASLAAATILAALSPAMHAAPAEPIYDEGKVPAYMLPDPLVCADGTPVRDAATWRAKRRPELLDAFAREVYGRTPAGRPPGIHWAVTSRDPAALGGKAVRKEVTVWFSEKEDGPKMRVLIYQPAGEPDAHAPWPVFLGLNFFGNSSVHADPGITHPNTWLPPSQAHHIVDNRATEGTRGAQATRWEIEAVVARGYATATIYCGDLCPDREDGLTEAVGALFGTHTAAGRSGDEWGAMGIWAWGLSRALDYFESDPELNAKRVAVHGHSRLGKAAVWAGAQDERFALVISNNSGCGGAALSKRAYGETIEAITRRFPHWFAKNFRAYADHESALPIDQHELLALVAPRPLYVASAQDDRWSDPRGEFLGLKHAEPVYRLFGETGLGAAEPPAVDTPISTGALAYHLRTGKHDITPYDWARYLDFADQHLKRK